MSTNPRDFVFSEPFSPVSGNPMKIGARLRNGQLEIRVFDPSGSDSVFDSDPIANVEETALEPMLEALKKLTEARGK